MRLLAIDARSSPNKAAALRNLWGGPSGYTVEISDIRSLPRSPLAYWASKATVETFERLPVLGQGDRIVTSTNPMNDDFRYARCWWEVEPSEHQNWRPWAKGGSFTKFYRDIEMVVNWDSRRSTYRGFLGTVNRPLERPASSQYFFHPGLTWSRRSQRGLSVRALPSEAIFGDKGPFIGSRSDDRGVLIAALGVVNSMAFGELVETQMTFGSFEVGVLQRTPFPELPTSAIIELAKSARRGWSARRSLDTMVEVSHAFVLPALLQIDGWSFDLRVRAWAERMAAVEGELVRAQSEVDELCFGLYGFSGEDRRAIVERSGVGGEPEEDDDPAGVDAADGEEGVVRISPSGLAAELVSWAVGVAVGRFDVRLATGARSWPEEPDPFDPLPKCSPAMLTGGDGLPLIATLNEYGIEVSPVLVDDPGHRLDIVFRVRSVFDAVFGEEADRWWGDIGAALGAKRGEVNGWLARGFFDHHLRTYSKSRRKAPILWPLGTRSGSCAVWLYAHRVSADSLFQILNDVIVPKLAVEERRLTQLRQDAGADPTASQRKAIDTQERFLAELHEFREELEAVAPLWAPDLNDGAVIVLAPLWRLFAYHRPWSSELKKHWEKLAKGDYDWAQLAMRLWPSRVVPKCAKDRSLAISHGLEDVFWVQDPDNEDKWLPRQIPATPIDQLIAQHHNPATTAALQWVTT